MGILLDHWAAGRHLEIAAAPVASSAVLLSSRRRGFSFLIQENCDVSFASPVPSWRRAAPRPKTVRQPVPESPSWRPALVASASDGSVPASAGFVLRSDHPPKRDAEPGARLRLVDGSVAVAVSGRGPSVSVRMCVSSGGRVCPHPTLAAEVQRIDCVRGRLRSVPAGCFKYLPRRSGSGSATGTHQLRPAVDRFSAVCRRRRTRCR